MGKCKYCGIKQASSLIEDWHDDTCPQCQQDNIENKELNYKAILKSREELEEYYSTL